MATLGSTAVAPRSGDNATLAFDVERVRHDFPVLQQHVHGKPLVYLDSGASAQKPAAVLETMDEVYRSGYANVHRGAYYFSQHLTDRYRSEEHTSELQSLMRISYAVFCLKKKNYNKPLDDHRNHN